MISEGNRHKEKRDPEELLIKFKGNLDAKLKDVINHMEQRVHYFSI